MQIIQRTLYMQINHALNELYTTSPVVSIGKSRRFVVFSDVHLGDGGKNDDFCRNADLFINVLQRYYSDRGYTLILNGDIEELQKFRLREIQRQWQRVFSVFGKFARQDLLIKIVGNHDFSLTLPGNHSHSGYRLYPSIRCTSEGQERNLSEFHKSGFLKFIGWHNDDYLAGKMEKVIKELSLKEERGRCSSVGQKLVDGQGAERMVDRVFHNVISGGMNASN